VLRAMAARASSDGGSCFERWRLVLRAMAARASSDGGSCFERWRLVLRAMAARASSDDRPQQNYPQRHGWRGFQAIGPDCLIYL
jgi:hypothetical protein